MIETFSPFLDTDFRLTDPTTGDPLVLRLTAVVAGGRQPGAPRVEPFTLTFSGPPAPILQQRTYGLVHDALGSLDIFLVPIGYDASGSVRYEAVFN